MSGTDVVNRLEAALARHCEIVKGLEAARDRAIRRYEPGRCCPDCDYIGSRGAELLPCGHLRLGGEKGRGDA